MHVGSPEYKNILHKYYFIRLFCADGMQNQVAGSRLFTLEMCKVVRCMAKLSDSKWERIV